MKKKVILFLSVLLMTQSLVPLLTNGTETTFSVSDSEQFKVDEADETTYQLDEGNGEPIDLLEETESTSEEPKELDYTSSTDFFVEQLTYSHVIETGKVAPTPPRFSDPRVIDVSDPTILKAYLEDAGSYKIRLTKNISLTNRIVIPEGTAKELDLNGTTINAGTSGQIEVQGNYFMLKNGSVIGGFGDNSQYVPVEDTKLTAEQYNRSGFIFAPGQLYRNGPPLENDIVIQDINHRNNNVNYNKDDSGGFMSVNTSNIFFSGNNTLTNGSFNIKGGSITFMDGKFVGKVTRQVSTLLGLGFDAYGDGGTINIGFFGWGTHKQRAISNQTNGDKRVTILENAEVELYNLNETGHDRYSNCIGNFSVLTVYGSLKMESVGPVLRTIVSEGHNAKEVPQYEKSVARTYNGHTNINIMEGSSLYGQSKKSRRGAMYLYNTTLNIYSPFEFELHDVAPTDKKPFFTAGNKNATRNGIGSEINLYDLDVAVWNVGDTNKVLFDDSWEGVQTLERKYFYSFVGSNAGSLMAEEPKNIGLSNFNVNNYGRIWIEGDGPVIVPDSKFKSGNEYRFGNGDSEFYGKAYYRKKDDNGNIVPIRNGKVTLHRRGDGSPVFETQTDNDGNWHFEFPRDGDNEIAKVGLNQLTVTEPLDNRTSKAINVHVRDTIPPTGETKLIKVEEGGKKIGEDLRDARRSMAWAKDETTPENRLEYEYANFPESERVRVLNKVGMHTLKVRIRDEAGNESPLIDAPVMVYKKGTDPDKLGFVEGNDFEVDKNIFYSSTQAEKIKLIKDYGNAKAFEFTEQGYLDVTDDTSKFKIDIGKSTDGDKTVPITLSLVINSSVVDKLTIKAILVADSITIEIYQVEKITSTDDIEKSPKIYSNLSNPSKENEVPITKIYYPKPTSNSVKIDDLLKELEASNRLKLDWLGYNQIEGEKDKNGVKYHTEMLFAFNGVPNGWSYSYNSTLFYSDSGPLTVNQYRIYVDYDTQIGLLEVPNLTFGEIEITSKNEETYELETPNSESNPSVSSNRATIINTSKKKEWALNLALKDNEIKNKKGDQFLGGLAYYQTGGNIIDITGDSVTLEHYNESNPSKVELIKEINFHSNQKDEGIRLKQRIGNSVGEYSGNLIWTLTDAPVP